MCYNMYIEPQIRTASESTLLSKIDPLTSVTSTYSAISALNSNLEKIEDAFENTLSRDGTGPNQMLTSLDMNHFRMRNVGTPTSPSDAVRLSDLTDIIVADGSDLSILATSVGSAMIGHAPQGSTTYRPLAEHLANDPKIFVEDYKYSGITVLTDAARLLAAHADWLLLGGALHYEPFKEYDLGSQVAVAQLINIYNPKDGSVLEGNGATIKTTTGANAYYNVLYLFGFTDLTIRNLHFTDAGFLTQVGLGHVGSAGGKFIVVDNAAANENNGLTLDNVTATEALTFLEVQGDLPSDRTKNIVINPNCRTEDVFYVLNFANNGDSVRGGITAINPGRVYFPYGVRDHDLDIRTYHDGLAEGATSLCLIKSYERNTYNINVRLYVSGSLALHEHLTCIEHSNTRGAASIVDTVNIHIDVDPAAVDTLPSRRLHLSSWNTDVGNGGVENTGNVAHITRNVRLTGNLGRSSTPHVKSNYTATSPCLIDLSGPIFGLSLDQTVDAPGFTIKTASDTFVYEKHGNLASGNISIDISDQEEFRNMWEVTTYAEPSFDNTDAAGSKMHYFRDLVCFYTNGDGSSAHVTGSPISLDAQALNGSTLARTFTPSTGDKLLITFSGDAAYTASTAFARVVIKTLSRPLMR